MLPNEIDYLVRQEQLKDHLRRMEHTNLIKSIKPAGPNLSQKIIIGLGGKMVQWGQSLQQYGVEQPKVKPA